MKPLDRLLLDELAERIEAATIERNLARADIDVARQTADDAQGRLNRLTSLRAALASAVAGGDLA